MAPISRSSYQRKQLKTTDTSYGRSHSTRLRLRDRGLELAEIRPSRNYSEGALFCRESKLWSCFDPRRGFFSIAVALFPKLSSIVFAPQIVNRYDPGG